MASLAWVLCPTTPYTTCAPTSSSCAAQLMLASSSNRAISSTTTVISLPRRAASIRMCISSESAPVRYTVCLIATTSGSRAACSMKAMTGPERLERVMQQHVALADGLEHVGPLHQHAGHARRERQILQLRARDLVGDAHEPHQVDRPVDLIQVVLAQTELLQQEIRHLAAGTDRPPPAAPRRRNGAAAARPAGRCAGSSPLPRRRTGRCCA